MSSHPNKLPPGARPKTTSANRQHRGAPDMRNANRSKERSRQGQTSVQGSATQQRKPNQNVPFQGASVHNVSFHTGNDRARGNSHAGQRYQGGRNSSGNRQEGGSNKGGGRGGLTNRSSNRGRGRDEPTNGSSERGGGRGGPMNRSSERGRGRGGSTNRSSERGRGRGGPTNNSSERGRGRGGPSYRSSGRKTSRGRGRLLDAKGLRDILDSGIEPSEIVMELATEKSGWKEFLERKEIIREIVVLLLDVMARACLCNESPRNLNSFLAVICQSNFLSQHLTPFISSLSSVDSNATEASAEELQPCRNIVMLLQTLLRCVPTFAMDEVVVNVAVLEIVCNKNDKIPGEIKEEIKQLKGICDDLQQNLEDIRDRQMVRSQHKPPPDDFRDIEIIPQTQEVRSTKRPFLRHNLIKGQYKDTEHYLDVQFRLLREDFVAPLREGVGEYLENIEDFQNNPRKRLQDVRLYRGVQIMRPIMTYAGTGHLIQFDTSPFQKIRWESSKRLINGSLLCLTEDDFQTVIFATVEGRDIWQLQRGELEVRFIQLHDVINKPPDATFTMAETSAYFESYRHVLEGLKVYNEQNLPMKSYIVETSNKAKPPGYLDMFRDSKPLYDLRITSQRMVTDDEDQPVSDQNADKTSETDSHDDDYMDAFPVLKEADIESDSETTDMRVYNYVQRKLRAVNILEPGSWPEADTLHFDDSQLHAFRAALSSEFSLIQGPPGTGKTYVGLEIVKSLLFNCHAWCHGDSDDWDFRPILVVCYTNHALDQFLEGIYHYEKDVVRVGGRCKTESLQDCCIANIRASRRKARKVPEHIRNRRADMQEYYDMRDILEASHERMALACSGLLSPSRLYPKRIMSKEHYRDLLSCKHVNPIFLWLVGKQGEGLPKKRSPNKGAAAAADDDDEDEDREEELLDISEEAALLAEQRELGNDPTFLMNREESRMRVETDFDFVPRKRINGESRKERINRQKMQKAIEQCINSTDPMSEEEVSEIRNIWELSHFNRWRLYCYWAVRYMRIQQDMMLRYQVAYERMTEERREIDREEDYLILRDAKVIGFTTTGAAKHRALLQRVRPRIIVVEEAAEVLEAHIITTLTQDCQHLILIGDHQQLRPKPTVYRLEKKFHLGVSLFERMINNGLPCHRLGQQHRMRPEISILMKEHFYDGLEDHSSVNNYPSVKGVTTNLFFVEHDQKELNIADNRSKSNVHEAKFLVEFCYYLLQQGYSPSQITILTTYTGQLFNFKRLMSKEKFEDQSGNRVRVSVVDNFQGEENDIILLSLVRSNDEGSIGFLNVHNRVCVALSRAKVGLFCIGNIRLLGEKSPLWKKIKKTATEAKQIGPKIPLVCQNHPETLTEISNPEDFLKHAPDGGCSLRCEARLECGHACRLYCHPKDADHKEYKCMKDCNTKCERGHKCTLRCYQECKCQVLIRKLFAKCQHTGMVKCHEDKTAICQKPCPKKMPCNRHDCPAVCGEECPDMCRKPCPKMINKCGHHCPLHCGMPCITCVQCKVKVEVKQPRCSHTYFVDCKDDPKWTSLGQHQPCGRRCERDLKCGHKCRKMCIEKCQTVCEAQMVKSWPTCNHRQLMVCKDADGAVCQEQCSRQLPCGHNCPKKCKEPCLTQCKQKVTKAWANCKHQAVMPCFIAEDALCRKPCTRKLPCGHKCQKACGDACDPLQCKQNCGRCLPCGHPCKKKCNESCDITSCIYQCKKRLPCRHRCHKLCNEPCEPSKCKEKVIKTWSTCNHKMEMTCSDAANAVCSKTCGKMLPCNHRCLQSCSEECNSTQCELPCARLLSCGHSCRKKCDEPCDVSICKLPCKRMLPCGHQCQKSCNEPCDITTCTLPCKRMLPCGHPCQKSCNELCSPTACVEPCQKTLPCKHLCHNKCNESCENRCSEKVSKSKPCGHKAEMPCSVDVTNRKQCFERCPKKLACGHQCKRMCGLVCTTVCLEQTEKQIPKCGHKVKTSCFREPDHMMCTAVVGKDLPACDHKIKLPCKTDPSTFNCIEACAKHLPCGHRCLEMCSDPCTTQCQMKVIRQHPKCGHYLKLMCYEDVAEKICREPCKEIMPCNHNCPKKCSEPCKTVIDASAEHRQEEKRALFGLGLYKSILQTFQTPSATWAICKESVHKTAACGHKIECLCCDDPEIILCQSDCTKKLSCGHPCPGTCSIRCDTLKCRVTVSKRIPGCAHIIHIECHEDPASVICQERCVRKLTCGHPCSKLCSEPCSTARDLCRKMVVRSLPECGHQKRLQCHEDPSKVQCDNVCKKKLPCGHECHKTCHPSWEVCETKCKVRLHKKITQCGHSVKLPCHLDPDSGSYCEKRCQQKLKCGHECKEKCGRQCTTKCKETKDVQKMLPCAHVAREIECYKDPQDVVCREQCTNRLSCGHDCKEVCGECSHRVGRTGGTTSNCKQVCRKRLLCGHQCRSKCSDCCGGRLHQPCRTIVNNITLLCGCKVKEEQCSKLLYLRRHIKHVENCAGLRLFGQTDVDTNKCKHKPSGGYCEEPCKKLLKCKHTCIGICGEPCIDLCRFCNRREILKIFQEFQAETDPCYIQLKECRHIFEVNELKRKLGKVSQNESSAPIHPITCPKCGRGISEGRFNEHSGTVADSVKEVVRMIYQQGSADAREAQRLLSGSSYVCTMRNIKKIEYGGGRQRRGQRGQPRTVTVRQEVRRTGEAHMVWKLKLLKNLDNILPSRGRSYRSSDLEHLGNRCGKMIRECVNGIQKLLESMLDEKIFMTEQLANDLGCELERAQWCVGLEIVSRNSMEPGNCRSVASLAKAVDIVTSPRPFTDQRRQDVTQVLDENMHSFLQIFFQEDHTELRRADILEMQRNELGFLAGDWFKCSKYPSHVFQSRTASVSAEAAPSCSTCEQDRLLFALRNVLKL